MLVKYPALCPLRVASEGPHQFRTRNGLNETQRRQSDTNKRQGKSTKPTDILPLITVWLQVRVLPGPPVISNVYRRLLCGSNRHRTVIPASTSTSVP